MSELNKRRDLSLKEKQEILERYDKLPKMNQRNAAACLKISQPLLCKILKNRTSIETSARVNHNLNRKRNRTGKDHHVESALKLWFSNVREKNAPINGPLMRQKAEELAKEMGKENFNATDGWFARWKKRENIVYKRTRGEKKSADFLAARNWITAEWPKIIAQYSPNNIFNADETALYFRAIPEHTYLFKHENSKGFKSSKERVTVLCCCNMKGMKQKLLVIGKSKNPPCFKGVKCLPVDYYSNSNAWMTSFIFNNWLVKWDANLKQKIVLLVDNCTAHTCNVTLKNIKIIFLPANTSSLIQPCNQGITMTLKAYYRKEMRTRIIEELNDAKGKVNANDIAEKISLLDALHILAMSWNLLSEKTIENCFIKGGFTTKDTGTANEKSDVVEEIMENPPEDMSKEQFREWLAIDDDVQVAAIITSSEICQAITKSEESELDEEKEENEIKQKDIVEHSPTATQMREALRILRRGVQHSSAEFQKHYEYERFINALLRTRSGQTLDEFQCRN